ncbi:hypothetical protein [Wohlfahrtiimonas chitiniclastica]|uniref:hypothetical protein n=1 Tax=Wohlfahrtiimonas chitiniclastica TaxID=400946 RepID=UPI000B998665|nr:hypothetical protein [Wohlfahrtiimonas chitiniclastica]MBS7815939.1 hypothetical protein [Wohlfahrtiimonas chitiniclastica]MBS7822066.1 hypothetical protein [Wohlfahrtiimonas chitiniclastica]MBS7829858.1 hypothetical protein [Wohlfahrtiimonas chitiniclastica]MBS7831825.1 hypothetical protein [Wohlfahrtiimonas chitiniclastica]OYQ90408.1 hypothetical protein B9T10_03560 [Wohlfahrtiimonas chitiniclastica]
MYGILNKTVEGHEINIFPENNVILKVYKSGYSRHDPGYHIQPDNISQPSPIYKTSIFLPMEEYKSLPIVVGISEGALGRLEFNPRHGQFITLNAYSFKKEPVIFYLLTPATETELGTLPEYGAVVYNENGGVGWHSGIKHGVQVMGAFTKKRPQNRLLEGVSLQGRKTAILHTGSDLFFGGMSPNNYYDVAATMTVREGDRYTTRWAALDNIGLPPYWRPYPIDPKSLDVLFTIIDVTNVPTNDYKPINMDHVKP